jgi:hypothetical protein
MTPEEVERAADLVREYAVKLCAPLDATEPLSAASEYLARIIELEPEAFKEYQQSEHYQGAKECLADPASNDSRKQAVIREMAEMALFCSACYRLLMQVSTRQDARFYQHWLEYTGEALHRKPDSARPFLPDGAPTPT